MNPKKSKKWRLRPGFLNILILLNALIFLIGFWFIYNQQTQQPATIIFSDRSPKKSVALTFDDGPYGEPTSQALDILKDQNVKATFFVVGDNARQYPELVRREIDEGHLVGNHSMDHNPRIFYESPEEFSKNLATADQEIFKAGGVHPDFFRPPFGLLSNTMARALQDLHYKVIMWNDMTSDYEASTTAQMIVEKIMKRIGPGAIIVLHDGRDTKIGYPRQNMLKTLPVLIEKIRQAGYEFIPLDQLIQQKPYFSDR